MSVFATSHGKQPCDGIGGTVKHLTAKVSLQRLYSDQILTPKMMFQYCVSNSQDIEFIYIAQENLNSTRLFLETRFEQIKCPIPGTRSFHEFVPLDEFRIAVKRCSEDSLQTLVHDFKMKLHVTTDYVLQYVACVYEAEWWVGIILEIDKD